MNALSEVRTRIADLLKAADLHPFAVIPEHVTPPLTYVSPGDPYVTREGATFGNEIVRCNVGVVTAAGVNDTAAEELDEQLLTVLDALDADHELVVGQVSQPGQIPLNNQTYLGVSVEVLIEITRS